MPLEELDRWLDAYGRAWERKEVDAFVDCFTEDAAYCWGPWAEPLRGHAAIRARTEHAHAEQEDIHFGHEMLAITPDGRGIARWWVSTKVPGEDTLEDNFGAEEPSGELGSTRGCVRFDNSSSEARKTRSLPRRRRGGFGNEGIFLVTLDADGKCTEFREWWNSRTRSAS